MILDIIMKSRYCNLYSLLRDQISEEQYIGIVKNQILVDVQGNDLLYQIFTANILQRNSHEEAPFLEFIQRVCSNKNKSVIKPGCGGFGKYLQ
jgi:4-hydroxyphenylpyruvate dioxygenase-like putative hemolysin